MLGGGAQGILSFTKKLKSEHSPGEWGADLNGGLLHLHLECVHAARSAPHGDAQAGSTESTLYFSVCRKLAFGFRNVCHKTTSSSGRHFAMPRALCRHKQSYCSTFEKQGLFTWTRHTSWRRSGPIRDCVFFHLLFAVICGA